MATNLVILFKCHDVEVERISIPNVEVVPAVGEFITHEDLSGYVLSRSFSYGPYGHDVFLAVNLS